MDEYIKNLVTRIEKLEKDVNELKKTVLSGKPKSTPKKNETNVKIDLDIPIRAYAKRYAAGKSGPQKFVLILAHLAKGDVGKNIEINNLRAQWSKMSGKNLLGEYNSFYSDRAKTEGWVDSPKHSIYCLTKEWRKVYRQP
jgi:hypothetical protein